MIHNAFYESRWCKILEYRCQDGVVLVSFYMLPDHISSDQWPLFEIKPLLDADTAEKVRIL